MSGDMFGALLQLVVFLPLVCLLAYAVIRYGIGRRFSFLTGRRMRVVEQLPLGPKSFLTLVQVGGRYYLLAHQDNAVALLEVFDRLPEELPAPAVYAGQWPSPPAAGFGEMLERFKDWQNRRRGRDK